MRKGITLVEIIVIFSIIGILTGLLYPAITQAMASNKRMQSRPIQKIDEGNILYSYYSDKVRYTEKTIGNRKYLIFIGTCNNGIDIEAIDITE